MRSKAPMHIDLQYKLEKYAIRKLFPAMNSVMPLMLQTIKLLKPHHNLVSLALREHNNHSIYKILPINKSLTKHELLLPSLEFVEKQEPIFKPLRALERDLR